MFIVYPQNERRPWPDEISPLTRQDVEERIIEALQVRIKTMTKTELIQLAAETGLVVEDIA